MSAWGDNLADLNAACIEPAAFGEAITLFLGFQTDPSDLSAILTEEPVQVGEGGAWEMAYTADLRMSDLTAAPQQGDLLITATGRRYLVDRQTQINGMYHLILREDPQQ